MEESDKDKVTTATDNSWIRGGINEQYVYVLYPRPSPRAEYVKRKLPIGENLFVTFLKKDVAQILNLMQYLLSGKGKPKDRK